jgi:putative ABC transport system ATP-binding protein
MSSDNIPALEVHDLTKTYTLHGADLTVLRNATFRVEAGATAAIVGPSGSGKSTLLGLCAGMDQPTSGSVKLAGAALESMNEDQRARHRSEYVGFVFQSFQLIPTLTALENVMVPAELRGAANGVRDRASQLLATVDLGDRQDHYPAQLSGGEQQRIALARAFINQPHVLFADEPTGNLDADTGRRIEDQLFELNEAHDTTLILVTHNLELAARTQRIIQLRAGEIVET